VVAAAVFEQDAGLGDEEVGFGGAIGGADRESRSHKGVGFRPEIVPGFGDGRLGQRGGLGGVLAHREDGELGQQARPFRPFPKLVERPAQVVTGSGAVAPHVPGLGPLVEEGHEQRSGRMQRKAGVRQCGGLVGGITLHPPGGGGGECGGGGRRVARLGQMPGHLGRILLGVGQGSGEVVVQAAPVLPAQLGPDDVGDEVVGGRPAGVTEPDETGTGQPVELVQDDRLLAKPRLGQQTGRHFPAEEGEQRQRFPFGWKAARHPPFDGPALSLPGHGPRQLGDVLTERSPPAVGLEGDRAVVGETADDFQHRQRRSVRVLLQGVGERLVGDEIRQRGRCERADFDLDDLPGCGQVVEKRRQRPGGLDLCRPVAERQCGSRHTPSDDPQEGEAGRVGPLEVVDDEEQAPGRLPPQQVSRALQGQRPATLRVDGLGGQGPDLLEFGQELGQRGGGAFRKSAGRAEVERERLSQQGPGQAPRFVPLRLERPDGNARMGTVHDNGLVEQTRLPRPRRTDDEDRSGPVLPDGGEDRLQLGHPTDEGEADERRPGGPGRRDPDRRGSGPSTLQLPFQIENRRRRLQARFVAEAAAQPADRAQGGHHVARSGLGLGQEEVGRLPQRLPDGGGLGQGDGVVRPADGHGGAGGVLQALQIGAGQQRPVLPGPLLVGLFGQRLTPPVEGRAEQRQRAGRVVAVEAALPLGDRGKELFAVDVAGVAAGERVPARARQDERRIAETCPGPVDEHLEVRNRVGRHAARPQGLGQDVVGDERPPAGDQDADEGSDEPPPEGAGQGTGTREDHVLVQLGADIPPDWAAFAHRAVDA
jgi:hypothetical protein